VAFAAKVVYEFNLTGHFYFGILGHFHFVCMGVVCMECEVYCVSVYGMWYIV